MLLQWVMVNLSLKYVVAMGLGESQPKDVAAMGHGESQPKRCCSNGSLDHGLAIKHMVTSLIENFYQRNQLNFHLLELSRTIHK